MVVAVKVPQDVQAELLKKIGGAVRKVGKAVNTRRKARVTNRQTNIKARRTGSGTGAPVGPVRRIVKRRRAL